jgi:uncharacterized protein YkwD
MTLGLAACGHPLPAPTGSPPVRIVVPSPGRALSEVYPDTREPAEPVRTAVFDEINRNRADAGLPPVAWDESAARVAGAFCAAQVAEKTRGHYLRDGVPPYARMGFAGVFGYHAENSASWITTGTSFPDPPKELALSGHKLMIEEVPPDDGHRRTILDPEATHVGVGWALGGGRFQLSQEFLARGLDELSVRTDERGFAVRIQGIPRPPYELRFVTVAREPLPTPLTRQEANAWTSYRYPNASEAFVARGVRQVWVVGAVTQDRIELGRDRSFSFHYAPETSGLYTFVFWLLKKGQDHARPLGSAVIRAES